ncbi:uncharacterized protein N7503_009216 [Penicillium pulvis]|uniref:uncharacterized protein n=1 Tax=Penicillium pulvis TaxID=1562058 RepID=UPI002547ABE7|nr:uncharacterized protein N7503_009216 [Penicillium pulvis]KAJ5793238.1 hypothetical protein N7503_009216 [Penicillium pulvis]
MSSSMALGLLLPVTVVETILIIRFSLEPRSAAVVFVYAYAMNLTMMAIWKIFIWPFFFNPLRHLPTVRGLLVDISLYMYTPRGKVTLPWLRSIPNDGLIHFRSLLNFSTLLVTNQRALKDVLSTRNYDFVKPPIGQAFLVRILGEGPLLSEGNVHKMQRKASAPAFTIKKTRAMYPVLWSKTQMFLDQLEKEAQTCPVLERQSGQLAGFVEIGGLANRLMLDITGIATISRDFQSLENKNNSIFQSLRSIFDPSPEHWRVFTASLMLPQWLIKMIPCKLNSITIPRFRNELQSMCYDVLHEKRVLGIAERKEPKNAEKDILDTIMRGGDFSDGELVDQIINLLAAGVRRSLSTSITRLHETTAGVLTWCCYHLALEPNIQITLRNEIRSTIPSFSVSADWKVLENMPYLNGVCEEALRLYPVVPMSAREAICETSIIGERVPAGTVVLICPQSLNRSPDFWGESAELFLPERWIDTDKETGREVPNKHGGARPDLGSLTFLYGTRACPGKELAKAMLRCAVAGVFGRFEVGLKEFGQKPTIGGILTSQPIEGMHLKLSKVPGWE